MATDIVLTPGGFRHRSLVHAVGEGEALFAMDRFVQKLDLSSNALIDMAEIAVLAPEEVPALGSGWITYAFWNNGTGKAITSFGTTWIVPDAPSAQDGQTIFLFNGIENYGQNFGILQPVLQWGTSAAGGGPYWSIASWYVTSGGQAFHTNLIPVNAGDTLIGVMTLTGQSGGLFNYTSEFQGISGTSLPVQNIAELLWCNETLEAYSVNQCADYPASDMTVLASISIETGSFSPSLNWTPVNSIQDCGQHTVVVSNSPTNGEVDIYYR
jgi:hypothetical protein